VKKDRQRKKNSTFTKGTNHQRGGSEEKVHFIERYLRCVQGTSGIILGRKTIDIKGRGIKGRIETEAPQKYNLQCRDERKRALSSTSTISIQCETMYWVQEKKKIGINKVGKKKQKEGCG